MSGCQKDCLGIDLGTTNSVIAYYNAKTDSVEILPNSLGDRITPSIVKYLPNSTEVLVGKLAIGDQEEEYPVISHVKRFIGRKYTPSYDVIEMLDYSVVPDHQDSPLIPVGNKKLKPEEVSSQILKYLKESAEEHLGRTVDQAVITVPAYFNESQRRATRDACTLAGLECLRLIAEPTAACLCYGLQRNQEETVLVYDLGGGTLDVSVLQLHGGIFEVVATSGNSQLGGADLDYLLMNYLKEKYQLEKNSQSEKTTKDQNDSESDKKDQNDSESDQDELPITQEMAEKLKMILSSRSQTVFRLGKFKYTITRSEFEELAHEFVEACLDPVERVLEDAELSPEDISQVVLVGGSTRVPIIQQSLSQWFAGKPLNKSVNPDEAVAYGAAIQASIIHQVGSRSKGLLLLDVTPLSLGIETSGGIMNQIIKRNSTLPCEASKVFSTIDDNQESVEIQVYQGERQFTKDNIKLGTFMLDGLPRAPRGVPKILVTFKLDCDGLLEVSAVDKNTGMAANIRLNSSESNLSTEEIDHLIKEAELNKTRDYQRKQAIEELNRFEKYVYELQRQVNLSEMVELLGEDLSPLNQYLINTMDWIVTNRNQAKLEEIQACRAEVEYRLKPYLDRMYSHQNQLEQSGLRRRTTDDKKPPSSDEINELIGDICSF